MKKYPSYLVDVLRLDIFDEKYTEEGEEIVIRDNNGNIVAEGFSNLKEAEEECLKLNREEKNTR